MTSGSAPLELRGAEGLSVGEVAGGSHLVKHLRLAGAARGASAQLTMAGAHASACRAVIGGTSFTGAGPHSFTTGHGLTPLALWLEVPDEEGTLDCAITVTVDGETATAAFAGDIVLFEVDAELDLGAVPVGETARATLTVEHDSRVAAEFTISAEAPFSCAAGTLTIDATSSQPIPLELTPTDVDVYEGTLTVARGDVTRTVTLRGEGIELTETDGADPTGGTGGGGDGGGGGGSGPDDYQRLYIRVPTHDTNVSLGKEYDADQHPRTHAGFSARTNKHVLFRSRGYKRSSTFQSSDQLWIQSTTDGVAIGAGDEGLNIISGDATYLSAGTGVTLAAGHGDIEKMEDIESFGAGVTPGSPSFESVNESLDEVKLGWSVVNSVMAAMGIAYSGMRVKVKVKNVTKNKKWKDMVDPANAFLTVPIAGAIKTAAMTGLTIRDQISAAERKEDGKAPDPVLPAGGVNALSVGGILGGTWAHCSIYGGTGVTFRSLNAAVLGLVNVSLDSLIATGMFGFNSAGMTSIATASVESGLKTLVGAGAGTLDVKGIMIEAAGGKALVQGGGGVNLAAPVIATTVGAAFTSRSKQFVASSMVSTTIVVGGKYGIDIGPAGVTVGSMAGVEIDMTKPRLEVLEGGIYMYGGGDPTPALWLLPTGVAMGKELVHSPAGSWISSLQVELA